jgi:hypothetical protein
MLLPALNVVSGLDLPAITIEIFATFRSIVFLRRRENNMLHRYVFNVISEKTPTTITTNECFPVWQKVLPKSSNLAKEIKSPLGCFGIICYLLAELFLKMANFLMQLAGNLYALTAWQQWGGKGWVLADFMS